MKTQTVALEGAVAGALATLPMSAVMHTAKRMGLYHKHPPEEIVEAGIEAAGQPQADSKGKDFATAVAHFMFGATAGVLFSAAYRKLHAPIPAAAQGMGFGMLVWFVSYKGWVPALGIMEPPERDDPERVRTMIAAHLVYGAILGQLIAKQDRRRDRNQASR